MSRSRLSWAAGESSSRCGASTDAVVVSEVSGLRSSWLTSLVIEEVTAVELVRQSVRSAAQRHSLAEPEVEVEGDLGEARVSVDRRRFERVMTNLIVNAEQYGGGATAVIVAARDSSVIIDVDDAGPGIAPEERDQVFQRFFRGRAAHDRSMARGTGLGLALVRDHVTSFGGSIAALESPAGGARFEITLPRRDGGAP